MTAKLSSEGTNLQSMPSSTDLAEAGILSNRQAEIWMLREIEGCSTSETADMLGIAESTVGTQLARARERVEQIQESAMLIRRAESRREQLAAIDSEEASR
jgi:transcriptional regulator